MQNESEPEEEFAAVQELDYDSVLSQVPVSEKELDLVNFRIKQTAFLRDYRLCMRQNLLTVINGLDTLINLEELDLYDNRIDKIEGLNHLVKLRHLDLSFNRIRKIENIENLVELTDLYFVSNKISKIEGLDTLTNLVSLELGANRIRVIENLDSLVNLKQLWVGKNKITSFAGLSNLKSLNLLSIQSNRISEISGISEMAELNEIYLSHNALKEIGPLPPNITTLDVGNNRIEHLTNLEHLETLEELWASYNQLNSFEEIEKQLATKRNLKTVYFEDHIPSLAKLDPNLHDLPRELPEDSLIAPDSNTPNAVQPVIQVTSEEFVNIIDSVKQAIEEGIYPVRISKGSSGSYFCKNSQGVIVGVFKPKNEEPYGHLNPKWTKWIHRNLFPCCFGRSCIIPNLGYISEAAASYVDRRLGLNIVPRTEIVKLASPSFHYSFKERWMHRIMKTPLKPKIGSFQLFLNGFVDSTSFFHDGFQKLENDDGNHPLSWSENSKLEFQYGFERLVILDYFIRNTDRGSDNWMIKSSPWQEPQSPASSSSQTDAEELGIKRDCKVQIAAIDNGLAFPTHHPDRVRSYPYGWTSLPIVHQPFSKTTANQVLPFLSSTSWMDATLTGIEELFQIDSDFKHSMWERQKAVIRGQGYNIMDMLAQSRHHPISPFTLVQRPLIMIHEDPVDEDEQIGDDESEETNPAKRFLNLQKKNLKKVKHRIETFTRRACFSSC
ncbi:phosphatidyl inositol kinase [Boothiomyces sp. JEL0866]|nr:phosphatidyl inositol kinase [Boothiomyces sp. JEL0866]